MKRLEGKVAVVTGAARGMGAAHSTMLAGEGADVALVDICRDMPNVESLGKKSELDDVVRQVHALGRRAIGISCDVSKAEEVESMVARVVEEFGKIDILVNNAAVNPAVGALLWEVPDEKWDQVMAVDLKGTFLCCKHVIPHMIKQRYGKIINIGSVNGREGSVRNAPYCAAKGGIHIFTHALAKDTGPYGINVNCVAPGLVRTPLLESVAQQWGAGAGLTTQEVFDQWAAQFSIFGKPVASEDISNAVVFLASEESRNIHGTVIYVDGGHP